MRGVGSILVKPRQQCGVILPTVVTAAATLFLGYVVLASLRYAAYESLTAADVDPRLVQDFLSHARVFFWIFGGVSVVLTAGGIVWAWWASFRVFGPLARLERDLDAILKGEERFLNLKTRRNDALRPLFDLFERFLARPRG
jgi:hypothetical protein